jgi:hypothetical protein
MSAFEVKGYGLEVYNLKYPYPGEKSWSDRAKVVGKFVASAESDEDMTKYEKKFNSFSR